ncbi:hypothetical protein PPYR_09966 [Photinus pyralis]|uniref:Uncharacterized protein n=1 Tax=Photinus pyralis TaxID=7054 RepID=A0A5N4AEZ3_PHOPY|nr:hypothetical protein PPYR_09966 [Photinus pyralis]
MLEPLKTETTGNKIILYLSSAEPEPIIHMGNGNVPHCALKTNNVIRTARQNLQSKENCRLLQFWTEKRKIQFKFFIIIIFSSGFRHCLIYFAKSDLLGGDFTRILRSKITPPLTGGKKKILISRHLDNVSNF